MPLLLGLNILVSYLQQMGYASYKNVRNREPQMIVYYGYLR